MAYAALTSLKQTIRRLINSPQISIPHASKRILYSAWKEVETLQKILKNLQTSIRDSSSGSSSEKMLNAFGGEIRDAAYKLEDAVEHHISDQFLLQSDKRFADDFELEILKLEIDCFKGLVKKMKDEFDHTKETEEKREGDDSITEIICFFKEELESRNPAPKEDDVVDFGGNKSTNMIGLSHQVGKIRDVLKGEWPLLKIIPLVGMVGTGKTTLARKVFEDESIRSCFNLCAFVTLCPNYQMKKIMLAILSQLNHDIGESETVEQVGVALYQSLYEIKYLLVLDDVRNEESWDEFRQYFPNHKKGSRILVTTRLKEVAEYITSDGYFRVDFLSKEESWKLLHEKVFGPHQSCPPILEKYGREIAQNCGGHPLTLIAFACLLSKGEKTPEYWREVAERKNSFFVEAYDEMSNIPLPGYYSKSEMSKEYNYNKEELESSKLENMIGLDDQFKEIKKLLTQKEQRPWLDIISLVGMAGIGKSSLAMKLFRDESIRSCFDLCAFVTIDQKYQRKEIWLAILSQLCAVQREEVERVEAIALYECLKGRRYLIVLDDVWTNTCFDQLYLPNGRSGSRVLVTTRLQQVAKSVASRYGVHQMRFLNEDESLYLLRGKVFGENHSFPDTQLEKAAKKILEHCQGLPLAIIEVAKLLSKDQTPQYWKEVAQKGHLVFRDIGDDMSKVLIKSYNYLPQHLKACFLYMGVFLPNCDIPTSKLVKLWIAEGFLETNRLLLDLYNFRLNNFARECLDYLACKSDLILVRKQSSNKYRTKTCSIHSAYWYLCNKEVGKEKVMYVVHSYADTKGMETQRRLCIHNNVLFGIKEVSHSIESSISTARSLLCTGPDHQYPLQISFSHWKLLRVLDALTIRFYEFPIEVLELVQLRYLALIYSAKIPPSIYKLWNLEYLIVHRHLNIVSHEGSCLPIEIWNMQKLRCLQVMGSDLSYDDHDAFLKLPDLLTLSYVGANSCTKEILRKTPNLKKLGIQIELAPLDIAANHHPLHCFDHLPVLKRIQSLKCVVVNPNPRSQVVAFPTSFPSSLEKLSLSGLGYPWEYMRIIARLPKLKVLKLRCYAFQGPEWCIEENEFPMLEVLMIEDTDVKYWRTTKGYCSRLRWLIIKDCYYLHEIPIDIFQGDSLETLEVVDCPLALDFVKKMQDQNDRLQVCAKSSWTEKHKSRVPHYLERR